jgi:hypothetical protein
MDEVGNDLYKKRCQIKISLICRLCKYAPLISYKSALRGGFTLADRASDFYWTEMLGSILDLDKSRGSTEDRHYLHQTDTTQK